MKAINTPFADDDSISSKYYMRESEFYVTLPSNSSMEYFPDNKTSNSVTKLSRTL